MKKLRLVYLIFAFLALAFLTPTVHAQVFVVLNKTSNFVQTGPSTVIPDSQVAFTFEANIDGSATNPAPPNTIALPANGGTRSLVFGQDGWKFSQNFSTQAALTAAFPNGTYQYTFGGRTISVPFNGDLFPNAPVATISGGTFTNGNLVVDRAASLTLTIAFTQNYAPGFSRLGINVNGSSGGPGGGNLDIGASNDSSNFTQTPLSFTVPANTFVAGGNYSIDLEANRLVTIDTASAPGYMVVSAYSSTTRINITVAGPAPAPTITAQPRPQTITPGSTVVFSVIAPGATNFQWRRDGVNLSGPQGATLVLSGTAVIAGDYSVVASNSSGSATSNPARLFVSSTTDFGHLINLSILSGIRTAGDSFTLGYVVGGTGTAGAKPLVIRAAGPSLGAFGVPGTLIDPRMELFAGSTSTLVNDNWGGSAAVTTAMAGVGAFPYIGPASLDAAVVANITTRDNSVKVSATGNGTGAVIAEVYDATPAGGFSVTTPRLLNVSVLKVIDPGTSLTVGFVLRGQTSRTVLIRAIGPGLATVFGIPGAMPDPQLTLFAGSNQFGGNDNWGGNGAISAAGSAVGAFAISDPNSRDAMLLVTLPPADYSVQVGGVGGVGGNVIVEVYEVP